MLDTFKRLIADFAGVTKAARRFGDDDYRLAAAALLVHLIAIDGETADVEMRRLKSLLADRFVLDAASTDELIREATLAEGESVDLYRFTSRIMRHVDEPGRLRIVEMMWELVFADGRVSEFEESMIWRAADLLAISSRDRVELRRRAAAASGAKA